MDDSTLLAELLPTAERLVDRHLGMAKEWFPHDLVEWRAPPSPRTPGSDDLLPDGVASALFVNLLTEDNLPSYHRLIHGMFGDGDGAWINWIGRWTAEEGRHAIVLRDYLMVTRNIDPILLERGRMSQLEKGYDIASPDTLHGLAYVAFQELATRISHRNTGRYSDDPVADRIMIRIAADENLHMIFYRNLMDAALQISPDQAMVAILNVVQNFEMPGTGIPGFQRKAVEMAVEGIYDLRQHKDEVLDPVLRFWKVFELEGLSAAGEAARTELAEFMDGLEKQALRFEDKRDMLRARMALR